MLTIIRQRTLKKLLQYKEKNSKSLPTIYYFGYGANIDPDFLAKRISTFEVLGAAQIEGYKFSFNTPCEYLKKGFGGISEAEGQTVYGTLYKLREESLELLDCLEWVLFNFYKRSLVTVKHEDQSIQAHVYIPMCPRDDLIPSNGYKNLIVRMAKKYSLPEQYIATLEAVEAKDIFPLDHAFNLRDPSKKRILTNQYYVLHDKLREKLCNLI